MVGRFLVASSLAIAAVAPAIMLSPAASATQVPPACAFHYTCTYIYYNNAQHSTQVGERYIPCEGTTSVWGTPSQWFTFTDQACSS